MESMKSQVGEKQRGFLSGGGGVDQIFVSKRLVKKYKEKRKELYVPFMDLEKAYDKIFKEEQLRVPIECGINGYLIRNE